MRVWRGAARFACCQRRLYPPSTRDRSLVPARLRGPTFPPGRRGGRQALPLSTINYGFTAYTPTDSSRIDKVLGLPGGSQPVVRDVDFDADGNAAVGASALGGPSGFLSGILLLDHTGRRHRLYRHRPLLSRPPRNRARPLHLDSGVATGCRRPPPDRQDYMIIRHFSADGKELKACLPRSSFPAGLEPGTSGPGVHIGVSQDRVGVLAYSGKTGGNSE